MSTQDKPWDEEDVIPPDVSYEQIMFELLHRTKSHTLKAGYVMQITQNLLEGDFDKQNLISLMAEGNRNVENLWTFIRKIDAFIKKRQEEYINKNKSEDI